MTSPFFYQQLSPPQQEAVETLHGPLLILAGAGSGKTRVLTYRVANLICQGEASTEQILAVTFTNKAAKEMKKRTENLLHSIGIPTMGTLWISTFHSLCAKILRQYIDHIGYQSNFTIYVDGDQLSVLRKILKRLDLNDKIYAPKAIKEKINQAKTQGLHPQNVETRSPYLMDKREIEIYSEYESELKASNALDFTDLLYKTYELFQSHPSILHFFQERFQYIMVDEYQDTNHMQYLLVKSLSATHKNLCVVGDEDQSIYSWRGADINNILDFEKDFPNAKIVKLEENHRSTKNIVEAASKVVAKNTLRKGKVLFTNAPAGDPITISEHMTDLQEAHYVVQKIRSLIGEGTDSYRDFAIFYRTNAQSRVLEDQLRHSSIPYKLVGSIRFYDRKEIKDILGYMQLAVNPNDNIACKRIINTPLRGIGKVTVEKLELWAHENKISLFEACKYATAEGLLQGKVYKSLQTFYNLIESLRKQIPTSKVSEIYLLILELTQYMEPLHIENTPEAISRIDNLKEFHNAILQFEEIEEVEEAKEAKEAREAKNAEKREKTQVSLLQKFLEQMSLVSSDEDQKSESVDAVTLMTLHISKGLEFPSVFIVGMEEGLFPTSRAIDEDEDTHHALEEERRLAYVGMTRTQKRLFLTCARLRTIWGQERYQTMSRFIEEIPEEYTSWDSRRSLSHSSSSPNSPSSRFLQKHGNIKNSKNLEDSANLEDFQHSNDFDCLPDYENNLSNSNHLESIYKKGIRVRHPTFGIGSICGVEGKGDGLKISIMFRNKRMKKFIAKFTPLERV